MGDYILAVIESYFKYGVTPTALVMALIYFFRTKHFKRLANRRVPWLFKDDTDVLNYQTRQIRIEAKIDRIAEFLGVPEWDVPYSNGRKSLDATSGRKNSLLRSLVVFAHARTIGALTTRTERFNHSKTREEFIQMTKDILSGKKKFLAMIIAVLVNGLNDVFDLNLSVNTLEASTYIAGGLIAVEGALDIIRALSNHFMQKNTVVTVTETPGTATTTLTPLTDVEKSYHGE